MIKLFITAAVIAFAFVSFNAFAQDQANPPTEPPSLPTIPDNMRGMSLSGGWAYDTPDWKPHDSSDSEPSKDKGAKDSSKGK